MAFCSFTSQMLQQTGLDSSQVSGANAVSQRQESSSGALMCPDVGCGHANQRHLHCGNRCLSHNDKLLAHLKKILCPHLRTLIVPLLSFDQTVAPSFEMSLKSQGTELGGTLWLPYLCRKQATLIILSTGVSNERASTGHILLLSATDQDLIC